ncbi:PAS domain S-box protein [Chloroflexota bacterium]
MGKLDKKTGKKLNTVQSECPDSFNLPEVSERRYRDLFNNASEAILIRDLNGNITEVNEAAVTLTGYTHNELAGMNISEFLTAESFQVIMKTQVAMLKEEATTQRYELEIIRKDGVRINAESRTSLLTYKGCPLGIQCVVRAITEQKRIEKALRASEERFRKLYEKSPIGIELFDSDGRLLTTNRACLDIFGVSDAAELLGFKFFEAQNITDEIKQRLHKGKTVRHEFPFDFEKIKERKLYNTSKSGIIYLNVSITPLGLENGKFCNGYLIQIQDITEQKRIEKALQESKDKYEALFENLNDAAFLADMKTRRILNTNKQGEVLLGCTREEIIGIDQTMLHPPEKANEYRQRFLAHTQKGHAADYDGEVIRKDGSIVPVSISASPINIGDKELMLGLFRNITGRKRAEQEIQMAEQNFRNSLDSSPLGIRIITAQGELLYANQAILDIYGYSSVEELKSVPTRQRYTPESYTEYQIRKERRKRGELVSADYEISVVRKDGEVRHLAVFRKAVTWGGEIQFQTLYQDITAHKKAEKALQESEEKFRAYLEGAPDGVYLSDLKGTFLYGNKKAEEITGYNKAELIGQSFLKLAILPRRHLVKASKLLALNATGRPTGPDEFELIKKDGKCVWVEVTTTSIRQAKEVVVIGFARDITERKQIETALQYSEEFNFSLLTNSPNPILVLKADSSIRYVNPALEKLTGYSSTELIGCKPPYPWWREENRNEMSQRLVQAMRRSDRRYESLYKKKNEELFWVEKIFKTVMVNGEFRYYLVNWVDLTEQKRLEANMKFYLSEITKAQEEERKRIAREIHDESIQSLATLALGIDAITMEKKRLPEDVIRRLKGLRTEANSILDELRRFSHELRPGVIDQVGLVPALEILTEELNKENRVQTNLEVVGSERRLIPEIELALFRIAQEALHNVQRHSTATKSAIRLRFSRSRVRLAVSDNGRGFEPPDILSDLAAEGKLGLIGIQERTRLLNGKLLVKSRVGRGTTVVVEVANID